MKGSKKANVIVKNAVWGLCALFFLAVVWLIAYLIVGDETVVASPWETAKETFLLLVDLAFWKAFFLTLLRAIIAFVIAALGGLVFALIAYLCPAFLRFFTAICAYLRALPTMAVLLILLVMFKAEVVPVVVGVLTLFPVLFTAYYSALAGVDKDLVEMSKTFGVKKGKRIFSLYLPSMKKSLIVESAAGLSFSLKLIVSAEILALVSEEIGLGWWLNNASNNYPHAPTLFALTIIICFVGIAIEWIAGLFVGDGV